MLRLGGWMLRLEGWMLRLGGRMHRLEGRMLRLGVRMRSLILVFASRTFTCAVKPVLNGHSKIDKTKILMTNGSMEHSAIHLTSI